MYESWLTDENVVITIRELLKNKETVSKSRIWKRQFIYSQCTLTELSSYSLVAYLKAYINLKGTKNSVTIWSQTARKWLNRLGYQYWHVGKMFLWINTSNQTWLKIVKNFWKLWNLTLLSLTTAVKCFLKHIFLIVKWEEKTAGLLLLLHIMSVYSPLTTNLNLADKKMETHFCDQRVKVKASWCRIFYSFSAAWIFFLCQHYVKKSWLRVTASPRLKQ